eukprot:5925094-Heterocapsa_arctica.AAC.1
MPPSRNEAAKVDEGGGSEPSREDPSRNTSVLRDGKTSGCRRPGQGTVDATTAGGPTAAASTAAEPAGPSS